MTKIPMPIPRWLDVAYRLRGVREIPGPRHNSLIAQGWGRLDRKLGIAPRFNDDETPWCGYFVAHCMDEAGLKFPFGYPRAKAWATYGTAESLDAIPFGAICVKSRAGGGHVYFPVAQSPDGRTIYGLGGNQNNAVNIAAFKRGDIIAARWPVNANAVKHQLPIARSAAELNASSNVTES